MIATANHVKPRLRGVFHELGFYAALGTGIALVLTAEDGRPRAAAVVFSACVAICFGASALYHRPGNHRFAPGSHASTMQASTCSSRVPIRRSGFW